MTITPDGKRHPWTVLQRIPSKSNPSAPPYEVRLGGDNRLYCTCWPWKKTRTCGHLRAFRAAVDSAVASVA